MAAPTCVGITLPSTGSVPSAFWEMLNWGAVDRILWTGVLRLMAWCVTCARPVSRKSFTYNIETRRWLDICTIYVYTLVLENSLNSYHKEIQLIQHMVRRTVKATLWYICIMFQVYNSYRFTELTASFNLTSLSVLISVGVLIHHLPVSCFHHNGLSRKSNLLLCVLLSKHHAILLTLNLPN
jgi:hypothetical protein